MKSTVIFCALVSLFASSACNSGQQNTEVRSAPNVGVDTLKPDTSSLDMPVVRPDTARQADMPVAKPPANIQPK
jgi:hypothetical protein